MVSDAALAESLIRAAPRLKGGLNFEGMGRAAAWIGASLAVVAMAGYLILQFAPQRLAFAIPDTWRERLGQQVETSLTEGAKQCASSAGVSSLAAMAARLAEGTPDLPPLTIHIYDVPVMNAFAMPANAS